MDTLHWHSTGRSGLDALRRSIESAQRSVRFETYIFRNETPGIEIRDALTRAAHRGVQIWVHLDAWGSNRLPGDFWAELLNVKGRVRQFNPFGSGRYLTRNHRKLFVIDEERAFVAGFNIGREYYGDGVKEGWADVGLEICGPSARLFAEVFDEHYSESDLRLRVLARYQKRRELCLRPVNSQLAILPVSPGRHLSCLLSTLYGDLPGASRIWICCPYFLPNPRLRSLLRQAGRRGADVRLILPACNDVSISQYAARRLYAGLLNAGLRIFEYQPQMLHSKIVLLDQAVYLGSSNLDPRSLYLNHELMVRCSNPDLCQQVETTLISVLEHSREVPRATWALSRTWIAKLKERWSYFLIYRLDPYLTHGFRG